ncbi:MAG TPA: sodium/substrate symporter small subunit [Xanthobacteraceae bacterium]|nr:sodium/substrate symporter small subunit [Xanthobacteraceae bacterium]
MPKPTGERFRTMVLTAATLMAALTTVKTILLMLLGLWVAYALAVQMFMHTLNRIAVPVLGVPLGTCLAVQGAIVVFLVAAYVFSRKHRLAGPT